ncbi:MAG: V-type ATPase subunit [Firmicutes bacterium]|nr:V-type ATPase subunit [Bacillota bacterium]
MSQASNVLLTKSRAMFGKRLTEQNVSDLLGCQTVTEVAAYLKNNTHYSEALKKIDDSTVHRGQLEAALDELLHSELTALAKYDVDAGKYALTISSYQHQIKGILSFLRLLSAGRAAEYVFTIPSYVTKKSGIDAIRLSQAKNYNEFLSAVSGSVFFRTLRQMAPSDGKTIDYTMIEHALYSQLFKYIESVINKKFSGRDREDLLGLLSVNTELTSFLNIYRVKKYYSSCGEDLARLLVFDFNYKISKKTYEKMLKAENADEVLEIFRNETFYGREIGNLDDKFIDRLVNRLTYKRVRHLMRFSTNPTVAVFSYLMLSAIERKDIVTIIEGVRYRMPPDDIASLITIA